MVQEHHLDIRHKKGSENVVADVLSRVHSVEAKCINEVVLYTNFFLVCKLVVGVLHPRTCLSGSVLFVYVLCLFCLFSVSPSL